jgi:uncharacterized membrane protein
VINGNVAGQIYWIYAENDAAGKVWEGSVSFVVHSHKKFMIDQDANCTPTNIYTPNGTYGSILKKVGFERINSTTPDFHYNLR